MVNKKIIIIIIVIVIAVSAFLLSTRWIAEETYKSARDALPPMVFDLQENLTEKTLTVVEVYQNLSWSDITIIEGSAVLPEGYIEVGDVITNCQGCIEYMVKGSSATIGTACFL